MTADIVNQSPKIVISNVSYILFAIIFLILFPELNVTNKQTFQIVGSAPNYPYGTMDDIKSLSDIALEYDVPLHVDACLGGFIAAFMTEAGYNVPVFDFRLPGVASISADTHKYGYAPKGTSVIVYRKEEYRHHQYTVSTEWPGGVYGSPTVNGSRAGGLIAACWATMMYVGREQYVRMAGEVVHTARRIEDEIRKINGLFIFGQPATTVVAFGSNSFDIFKLADLLHQKGWSLNALQFPSGIHIAVTHAHTRAGVADRFLADLKETTAVCMKEGSAPVEGKMAIYGVAQSIPDRSLVSDITKYFIDSMYYLPKPGDDVE
nr:sphingosine-1-phosphate lyase-like [Danaus plexippus plexippus]